MQRTEAYRFAPALRGGQLNADPLGGRGDSIVTLFEYLAAAHTLILTFALTRALSGVAQASRPSRRSLLHLSWLGFIVSNCLFAFWAMWGYAEVEWTLFRFLGLLTVPVFMYVFSSIIVPPDPSAVESWTGYLLENRVPLFATGGALFIAIALSNQLIQGASPTHPLELCLYATVGVFGAGLASANARLHAALAFWPPLFFPTDPVPNGPSGSALPVGGIAPCRPTCRCSGRLP